MNRRIVILGDDEFLSDEFEGWGLVDNLRAAGVSVEVIYTDDRGMSAGITAALSTNSF